VTARRASRRRPRGAARAPRILTGLVVATALVASTVGGTTSASAVSANRSNSTCSTGGWSTDPTVTSMPAERYATEHFSFRWTSSEVSQANVENAATSLESYWSTYLNPSGIDFPAPFCESATKRRVNVHLDPTFGLTGGVTGEGAMGMWINSGAYADHHGLAHELAHALQGATGGLRDNPYVGWMWESHANWMTHQLPEFRSAVHCSEVLVNSPHLRYGSTRDNYCNWQFWEHLKNVYGYDAVNDIWANAPEPGQSGQNDVTPLDILRDNLGWSTARLNDEFGTWAMRNITWDYVDPDGANRSSVYRNGYGSYDDRTGDRVLRVTPLDPVAGTSGRWAVPNQLAPQQGGYNVVRLVPQTGRTSVTVNFQGLVQNAPAVTSFPGYNDQPDSIPNPNSGWRWGVVAESSNGTPRYSALQSGTSGNVTVPVRSDDRGVYLVVLGAPTTWNKVKHGAPWFTVYRYPWTVTLDGATPQDSPKPAGSVHPNGGGWVANGASVASTAYVGPRARVLGGTVRDNARIEDRATVQGGTVEGNARVLGVSVIRNNARIGGNAVVDIAFRGVGQYNGNAVVNGSTYVGGDLELWADQTCQGSFYGFTDNGSLSDATMSARQGGVPEVTARTAPGVVRLQSWNYPDRYVRHADFDARIDPGVLTNPDSGFTLVPGLAGNGSVSFESVNYPGFFLRQTNSDMGLSSNDGSASFAADVSFMQVAGLASATGVSFVSVARPGAYLRHSGYSLRLDPITDPNGTGGADATFRITP
jgi:hypothetical protein